MTAYRRSVISQIEILHGMKCQSLMNDVWCWLSNYWWLRNTQFFNNWMLICWCFKSRWSLEECLDWSWQHILIITTDPAHLGVAFSNAMCVVLIIIYHCCCHHHLRYSVLHSPYSFVVTELRMSVLSCYPAVKKKTKTK